MLALLLAGGCALQPAYLDDRYLYLGAFKVDKQEDAQCSYVGIRGLGLQLGMVNLGAGYLENRRLVVTASDATCHSDFVDAYVGSHAKRAGNLAELLIMQQGESHEMACLAGNR